jgi:hypothetical protein
MKYKNILVMGSVILLILLMVFNTIMQVKFIATGEMSVYFIPTIVCAIGVFTFANIFEMMERIQIYKKWKRIVIITIKLVSTIIFAVVVILLPILINNGVSIDLAFAITNTVIIIFAIVFNGGSLLLNRYFPKNKSVQSN